MKLYEKVTIKKYISSTKALYGLKKCYKKSPNNVTKGQLVLKRKNAAFIGLL